MRASRKGLKRSIAINGANGQAPPRDADNELVDKDNNEFHNNSPNGKSVKSSKKEAKITVEDSNENGVQCHPAKDEEDSVQVDSNRITEDENNGKLGFVWVTILDEQLILVMYDINYWNIEVM